MATLAAESHDSPIDAHDIDSSFTFDSDHGLDLSLDHFPAQRNSHRHLSFMSNIPTHPIPSMQAAFAESMLDAFDGSTPAPTASGGDAMARRKLLLEQHISEASHAARWKQKPGQRYHELWKLMSQISFGIYLLLGGLARDDDQALTILQGHVDEIDLFLEMTLEDFDLAQEDIDDRLKNLKLPLQNIHIFEGMLEDREFRNQIVTGNETIEHIITRTASAMDDALKNVQHGMAATKEFATYMSAEQSHQKWQTERPEMKQVFEAMMGNADGWYKAYISLETREHNLGTSLVQLGRIVAEIDKLAADISRKTRYSVTTSWKGSSTLPVASPPQSTHHLSVRPSRSSMRTSPRPRPSVVSTREEFTEGPAMIAPTVRANLPVFDLVAESEESPEQNLVSDSYYSKSNYSISVYSHQDKEFEEPPPLPTLSAHTYTPPPLTPRTYSPASQFTVCSNTPEPRLETPPTLTPRTYSPASQLTVRSNTPESRLETPPTLIPRTYSPASQFTVLANTPEPELEIQPTLTPRTYSPASKLSIRSNTPEPELEIPLPLTPRTYSPAPQLSVRLKTPEPRLETPPPLTPRTYSPAPQLSVHSHTPEPELEIPLTLTPRTYSPAPRLSLHSNTPEPELEIPPPLTPGTYSPAPQLSVRSLTPESELGPPPKLTCRSSLRDYLSARNPDPAPLLSSKSYTSITSRSSNHISANPSSHKPDPAPLLSSKSYTSLNSTYSNSPTPSISQHQQKKPSNSNSPTPPNSQPQQQRPTLTTFPRLATQIIISHDRKSPPNPKPDPDSAYFSDASRVVSVAGTPSQEYHQFIASSQPATRHDFDSTHIATPRSDQQHFQPVQASPHSPLQRPWTAAPSERGPPGGFNGYSSSFHNGNGGDGGGGGDRDTLGVLPSNMSQMTRASGVSGITVGVDAQGKKIKKKRSGFGWLKKAFSLSEEEKREFEEARRRRDSGQMPPPQRERVFLDGRRLQR